MEPNSSSTSSVLWKEQTYSEIQGTGSEPGSLLVVPVGSIEQHGQHLPVGTDTYLVEAIANGAARVSSETIPILVTPPVWSGFSPHHMDFGGTITLESQNMMSTIENICSSALENGFDAVVLINGHGGNVSLIDSLVSTVGADHPNRQVLGTTYYTLAQSFIDDIRESDTGGMAHGGEFETSLMLHLHPDLVKDESEMEASYMDDPYEQAGQDLHDGGVLGVYRSFKEYSHTGAIGDPLLASPEKGERIYELLLDELTDIFERVHEQNV
jgi:creatinine amidohydrolase